MNQIHLVRKQQQCLFSVHLVLNMMVLIATPMLFVQVNRKRSIVLVSMVGMVIKSLVPKTIHALKELVIVMSMQLLKLERTYFDVPAIVITAAMAFNV